MINLVEYIIGYHCAPAIRGIKVANLVAIPRNVDTMVASVLSDYNTQFNPKGLHFYELCHCKERRLLLVYRKKMLDDYLRQPGHMAFLQRYGYDARESLETWLVRLRRRVETEVDFPHEIGLFLGYPLVDVKAFIASKGNGYKLCGEWKVYENQVSAMRSFYCFRVCREFCHTELLNGKALGALVAATAC